MNHLNILFNQDNIKSNIDETEIVVENNEEIISQTILNDASSNIDVCVNSSIIEEDNKNSHLSNLTEEEYHTLITNHLNSIPSWNEDKIQLFKKIPVKDINNVFGVLQDILRIEGNSFSIENFISMRNDKNKIKLTFSENFQNEILNVERKIKLNS